jgi:hypothetical protein
LGAMPANVLESALAIVIAWFANKVQAVTHHAAPIQAESDAQERLARSACQYPVAVLFFRFACHD